MDSTKTVAAKISIKVFVNTEKNRVVFAEADHNFVDVLFSFMTLPMGAIVRLLAAQDNKKFESLSSFKNLYQSLTDLPVNYFCNEECKFTILNPRSKSYDPGRKLKLNIDDTGLTKYYACEREHSLRVTPCSGARCHSCPGLMTREACIKHSTDSAADDCDVSGVFVSDMTTYIVTDDLRVMPCTPGSCVKLLMDVGITDASHLQEIKVDIDHEKVLDILRLALSLDSPLTYLVLGKTHPHLDSENPEQGNSDECGLIKKEIHAKPKVVLQVFLRKSTGEVLFAEAEEDFVDFVSGFLAISLGTVIGTLMNRTSSLVCMDNIFRSISDMSVGRYLKSEEMRDILLEPHFGHHFPTRNLIFPLKATHFYEQICVKTFGCYLRDPRIEKELLKKSGSFVVTDDLVVKPPSSVSSMDILKELKVPLNDIDRHEVGIGLEEGIKMLKASLRSSSVLTNGLEHQLRKKLKLNPSS